MYGSRLSASPSRRIFSWPSAVSRSPGIKCSNAGPWSLTTVGIPVASCTVAAQPNDSSISITSTGRVRCRRRSAAAISMLASYAEGRRPESRRKARPSSERRPDPGGTAWTSSSATPSPSDIAMIETLHPFCRSPSRIQRTYVTIPLKLVSGGHAGATSAMCIATSVAPQGTRQYQPRPSLQRTTQHGAKRERTGSGDVAAPERPPCPFDIAGRRGFRRSCARRLATPAVRGRAAPSRVARRRRQRPGTRRRADAQLAGARCCSSAHGTTTEATRCWRRPLARRFEARGRRPLPAKNRPDSVPPASNAARRTSSMGGTFRSRSRRPSCMRRFPTRGGIRIVMSRRPFESIECTSEPTANNRGSLEASQPLLKRAGAATSSASIRAKKGEVARSSNSFSVSTRPRFSRDQNPDLGHRIAPDRR